APNTVQVVKMNTSGSAIAGQQVPSDGSGAQLTDRITAGALVDLQRLDGLSITDASANVVRRIVTQLFLDCKVDPLPASLHNAAIEIERMQLSVATQATGKMQGGGGTQIQKDPGQTASFTGRPAVSIKRQSDGLEAFGVLLSADPSGLLTLSEPLPSANFSDT